MRAKLKTLTTSPEKLGSSPIVRTWLTDEKIFKGKQENSYVDAPLLYDTKTSLRFMHCTVLCQSIFKICQWYICVCSRPDKKSVPLLVSALNSVPLRI
jgi:hypothetical protein